MSFIRHVQENRILAVAFYFRGIREDDHFANIKHRKYVCRMHFTIASGEEKIKKKRR